MAPSFGWALFFRVYSFIFMVIWLSAFYYESSWMEEMDDMDDMVRVLQSVLQVIVALVSVSLSKYRYKKNKEYAQKYKNNPRMLVLRIIITVMLQVGSAVVLISFVRNIDPFYTLYIITPIILALNIVLFDSTEWLWGLFTMVKGVYYAGIAIISICQYFIKADASLMTCALGFTLSLGIFEAITASASGLRSMREVREKESADKK